MRCTMVIIYMKWYYSQIFPRDYLIHGRITMQIKPWVGAYAPTRPPIHMSYCININTYIPTFQTRNKGRTVG
jgi:hypothetical protein